MIGHKKSNRDPVALHDIHHGFELETRNGHNRSAHRQPSKQDNCRAGNEVEGRKREEPVVRAKSERGVGLQGRCDKCPVRQLDRLRKICRATREREHGGGLLPDSIAVGRRGSCQQLGK